MQPNNEQRVRLQQARQAFEGARAERDRAIHAAAAAGLSQREIAHEVGLSGVQVGRILDRASSIPRDRRATWVAHALTFVPKRSRHDDDLTQSLFRMALQNAFSARLAGNPELADMQTVRDVVTFAAKDLPHAPDYEPELLTLEWPHLGQPSVRD